MLELNKIYLTDCVEGCKQIDSDTIDLVVTSPPYDNLRNYDSGQGLAWGENTWKNLATELYRVVKPGGVVVWIVNDATVEGCESLTSFKQALHFNSVGFNVFDTMIWIKAAGGAIGSQLGYRQNFEYMFVFSKGRPKSINLIKDLRVMNANVRKFRSVGSSNPEKNHKTEEISRVVKLNETAIRNNWWYVPKGASEGSSFHPAVYPPSLARDHIISWSNKGDLVLDPFMGSGTTAIEAVKLGRKFIGFDVSPDYIKGANARLRKLTGPFRLYGNIGID